MALDVFTHPGFSLSAMPAGSLYLQKKKTKPILADAEDVNIFVSPCMGRHATCVVTMCSDWQRAAGILRVP
jgi:hypothetical protein